MELQRLPQFTSAKSPFVRSLLQPPPFSLALDDSGSVLAVKGSLRRFAPWTAAGRSERRAAHEGKGGDRSVGREGELAHDKGYYHSCLGGGGAIGAEAVLGRGSIPACAGEPEIIDSQSPRGKVYPRVGGGVSRLCLTWAAPRLVLIRSPCIRVSSRQVRSRSTGDRVSVRRALSSEIRFSSMAACPESLSSSSFSLVRSIPPWGE